MTKTKTHAAAGSADWLEPHRLRFLETLADQGYATATLRTYDAAARLLCREVREEQIREGQLVGGTLSRVRAASLEAMHPNRYDRKKYCLERFIETLVEAGVAERPRAKRTATTALDRLQSEYESYLRDMRGLTDKTIYDSVCFLRRFMAFRFGERLGSLNDITPRDIRQLPAYAPWWQRTSGQDAAVASAQSVPVPILERQDKP